MMSGPIAGYSRYTDREGLEAFILSKTGVSRAGPTPLDPPLDTRLRSYVFNLFFPNRIRIRTAQVDM